jgi:hypothetical protein
LIDLVDSRSGSESGRNHNREVLMRKLRVVTFTVRRTAMLAVVALLVTVSSASAQGEHRSGLWGGLGFGWSSLRCFDCGSESISGWGGVGRIGGTLSPEVRIGAGTNTWNKSEGGTSVQVSSLEFQAHWFPGAADWFLYGGAGLGGAAVDYDYDTMYAAFSAGGGYSINLGQSKKVALVPEVSMSFLTTPGKTYFLQASLGFFWN